VYHTLYSSADAALSYTTQPLLVLTQTVIYDPVYHILYSSADAALSYSDDR